jgi:uncharacterized protein
MAATLVCFTFAAPRARAEARRTPVRFPAGKNAVTIIGKITGEESVEYLVPAKAGRELTVSMESANDDSHFNVSAPGAAQALFNGAVGGESWRGPLPVDGEYTVEVYLVRDAAGRGETAKYTLDIAVGAPTAVAEPTHAATPAAAAGPKAEAPKAEPPKTEAAKPEASKTEAASAKGPSFDCAKAEGPVETAICKDEKLAALDRTLAEVFAAAGTSLEPEDATIERDAQRAWLKTRNSCGKRPNVTACVRAAYEVRIAELQVKTGTVVAPVPVDYTCGQDSVRVYFYQETQVPAAVVNVGANVQDFAVTVPAASGARYQGKRLVFWTKGDTATLTRAGADVSCRKEP